MRIEFKSKHHPTTPLVAEAWLVFEEAGLEGMMLEGFAVWKHKDGRCSVTFPSRPYTVNGERHHHWLIHSVTRGDDDPTYRLRQMILTAYREWSSHIREYV